MYVYEAFMDHYDLEDTKLHSLDFHTDSME